MKYVIGVDGGGTKTEAVAFDGDGEEWSRGVSGFGNLVVDPEQAAQNIEEAIDRCREPLKGLDCAYIYLGLAGIEGTPHRADLEQRLKERFRTRISLANDAMIAHAASLEGKDGILTISGTGSISWGVCRGRVAFTGGWGHLLGDEGSGYWIAIEAFRQMIREEEESRTRGPLSRALLRRLDIDRVHDIKTLIYESSKAEIAAVVPIVAEEADGGDPFSRSLLERAGRELAEQTVRLHRKLDFQRRVAIGLKGGVLLSVSPVREAFVQWVKESIPQADFVEQDVPSTKGAYFLAIQELQKHG
ncbi:BadF/BadG/BcrA/BcrD ATPase family protein [Paludifilum halophilum]|uniref:BadF/BadG/BcrA/BcrD ATPase family protein n=1 Tax=Paludifilum halophilum TaxID=1642702 RepID=UPI00146C5375|nr:BadF/BadG/BcrA/BcrD ATPase family protein [Paludifilum halophilum]